MYKHSYVIGGGIIGLATCFELQNRGLSVTLIDPDPASGSTYHAGGMLAPIAEVQYQQQPLFPLMEASAYFLPSLVERLSQVSDLPTGYRNDGTLVVGADRTDGQHLNDIVKYLQNEGLEVNPLTVREARTMEPALTPQISNAIGLDHDYQLSPRLFCAALVDAIDRRGAEFINEKVASLSGSNPCTTIELESREIDASKSMVVLCAGLGAAEIDGWFEGTNPLKLRPVYGEILKVRVPEKMRPLISKVVRGFVEDRPIYLIPREDGTVTIGATSREDDESNPKVQGVFNLLRDATRIVPGIEECEFIEASCGARPGTPDDLPYLGQVGSNLIISTGYFRHGILLSALAAQTAAQLTCDDDVDLALDACNPLRDQDE